MFLSPSKRSTFQAAVGVTLKVSYSQNLTSVNFLHLHLAAVILEVTHAPHSHDEPENLGEDRPGDRVLLTGEALQVPGRGHVLQVGVTAHAVAEKISSQDEKYGPAHGAIITGDHWPDLDNIMNDSIQRSHDLTHSDQPIENSDINELGHPRVRYRMTRGKSCIMF